MHLRSLAWVAVAACCVSLAFAQDAARPDKPTETQRVMTQLDGHLSGYADDYAKLVARARDRFNDQAKTAAGLAVRQLETEAARAVRAGDLKTAGDAYFQVLRLNINHKKARGHFEAIKQLDQTLKEVAALPMNISAPAAMSGSSADASAAWKRVLQIDRNDEAARTFFNDRGDLRKVLASITPEPPKDAVEWNGHFYTVVDQELTWHQAAAKCEALGGGVGARDVCRGEHAGL